MDEQKKTVLMLCHHFPPYMGVGSLRSRKYAQYLPDCGWGCRIITAYKDKHVADNFSEQVKIHPTWSVDFDSVLARMVKAVVMLRRIWSSKNNSNPGDSSPIPVGGMGMATKLQKWFLLPDPQFLWILLALPRVLWVSRKCEVIYSSAWPVSTHVLGLIVYKLTGKPWVADYRDEWTLNSQWFPATRFHRWLGEKLDRACMRNAHYVVNVTEARTENFKKKYPEDAQKCVTIHNGYDEKDVAPFRDRSLPKGQVQFVSLGSLYGGRNPKVFIEALKSLLDEGQIEKKQVKVSFIGANSSELKALVRAQQLDGIVHCFPRLPQKEAFEKLANSHVALVVGSDMERVAMTTKVYEYAGMGKFIFALVPDGPVKAFVEQCGGEVAAPNDKRRISEAILRMIDSTLQKTDNAQQVLAIAEKYERSALAAQQAELLDRCLLSKEGMRI